MSTEILPVPDVVLASEFPSLADRPAGTYNAKAKAWADSENAMAQSVRDIAGVTHNNAVVAHDAAVNATAAAQAATAAANAPQWEPGKVYALGDAVWSPIDLQTYRRRSAGSSAVDPAHDPTNWQQVGGAPLAEQQAAILSFL